MVLTSDHQKNNLGLSIKFEVKSLKVIDYSRKAGRYWEFSEKAVDLIRAYKVLLIQIASEFEFSPLQDNFPEIFAILDRGGDGKLLD
jgi:5'-3' exoribonuclease 1